MLDRYFEAIINAKRWIDATKGCTLISTYAQGAPSQLPQTLLPEM